MMESQPFVLVELEDLSSVFSALKTTSRIQYTCFNVSNNYLIFGATSGGLYVFRREPCCFLQILPSKEGAVTQIAVSPDEKLIAFSTVKGLVCILEKSSHGAKPMVTTAEHQTEQVTCLQWNEASNELYIGDKSGKVSVVTVSIFPTKSMFQNPSCVLMQLDSKIVQMDFNSNMLLVSTLTKCYICDTAKEIFRQVGHKLRDGEYGACIFNTQINSEVVLNSSEKDKNAENSNLSHLKLLCARPGSRIWEVAIDGTVISTHHFKKALAVPPKKIFFLDNSIQQNKDLNHGTIGNGAHEQNSSSAVEQSFNFQKLFKISHKFFLTYRTNGLYIFDHQKASVVLWNNEITNITDVKCVNDVIYVWSGHGKMFVLNLVPLKNFLVRLYFQGKYEELANLCLEHESFLLTRANDCSKFYILHDLDEKLRSDELRHRLSPIINLCKENAQKRKNEINEKLHSGICLVNNNDRVPPDEKKKYLRPSYLNLKVRSHSVSPERFQNGGSKHQGSCPSLPDLVKDEEKTIESKTPSAEVVVNGRNVAVDLKIDTEIILKTLDDIKKTSEPSRETIFTLFQQILHLSCNDSETINNLESVESFPFNLYFTKSDVKLISDLFRLVLSAKSLFEWLSNFTGDWLSNAIKNYPFFLIENTPTEHLYLDYKMSKIVKLFSCVLIEKDIIELIKKSEMKCYYATLNEVLGVYHDSSVSNINLINVTSTPKLLNTVYFLMSAGQIEQCSKYASKIDLHDVFYLTLKCEKATGLDSADLQCRTMFLSYLDKAAEDRRSIANCSDVLEKFVVDCLSSVSNSAGRMTNCSCGFPGPGVKNSVTVFPNVGHALLDKNWPGNPKKCLEICARVPYLWKYFIFLRWNEPLLALLPLLIQAGEIVELENRCYEINESLIEIIMESLIKLKMGTCLNCNKNFNVSDNIMSWTGFGCLCVKLLGPRKTLNLFKKYSTHISSNELDERFYQSLIFSAIMEKHCSGLRKNVVDLLVGGETEDSGRTNVFSDELSEKIHGKNHSPELGFKNADNKFHHWGTKVNFKDNCAVCSLPLETKVLISEAGLIVFKCAHVFHSACLKKVNLECPICKRKTQP